MSNKLFVYGSLSEGMIHHKIIKDAVLSCRPAKIKGTMYRLEVGYPVYLLEGEQIIDGYLVELRNSDVLWAILDEFHGVNYKQPNRSLYERVSRKVWCDGEVTINTVYALRSKKLPKNATLIQGGNWEQDFRDQPSLTERFKQEELEYIYKLGNTTGREVIPYTPLTRDMEKMGIVVDKGRRPALTAYGKEIYKYLEISQTH